MATTWRVTASYTVEWRAGVDCSPAEVLGFAHGRTYRTQAAAREAADELQGDACEDLDDTTEYSVMEADR